MFGGAIRDLPDCAEILVMLFALEQVNVGIIARACRRWREFVKEPRNWQDKHVNLACLSDQERFCAMSERFRLASGVFATYHQTDALATPSPAPVAIVHAWQGVRPRLSGRESGWNRFYPSNQRHLELANIYVRSPNMD